MARAHNADIVFVKHQGLKKSGRQIIEKSRRKIDLAGAQRGARIVQRDRQDARRCARRLLLQEFQQRWQEHRLPHIIHEKTEDARGGQRIELITRREACKQRVQRLA